MILNELINKNIQPVFGWKDIGPFGVKIKMRKPVLQFKTIFLKKENNIFKK